MINADDTILAAQKMEYYANKNNVFSVIFVGHMGLKHGYLENPLDPLAPRPTTSICYCIFYSLFINFGKQYQVNVGSPSATLA